MNEPHNYPLMEMEVEDIETLKLLTDPKRLKILSEFSSANTVKEVAISMGLAPQKLYYHINLMVKHDILVVVGERMVSGILEKTYIRKARTFRPVDGILTDVTADPSSNFELASFLRKTLNTIRDDFISTSVRYEELSDASKDDPQSFFFEPVLYSNQLYILREDYSCLTEKIEELNILFKELNDKAVSSDADAAQKIRVSLGQLLYSDI